MQVTRFDRAEIKKATKTAEGYLIDTPVVGRVGIQLYMNKDGSVRRELRPPEEVFRPEYLKSFAGKPITDGHPQSFVTASNARKLTIGMIQSDGIPEGSNVLANITIFDQEAIDKAEKGGKKELSLGYKVDIEMIPGVWEGQAYDAVQRNMVVNHLSLVERGRAGNARLNLDGDDAVCFLSEEGSDMQDENLPSIKLDNGIEYKASQEVKIELEGYKKRFDDLSKELDKLAAERDALKGQVESAEKVRADALALARDEVKNRALIEEKAKAFNVDCAGKTDREIKESIIKAFNADASISGKSDEYINAYFDFCVNLKKDSAIEKQRQSVENVSESKSDSLSVEERFKRELTNLGGSDAIKR